MGSEEREPEGGAETSTAATAPPSNQLACSRCGQWKFFVFCEIGTKIMRAICSNCGSLGMITDDNFECHCDDCKEKRRQTAEQHGVEGKVVH